MEQKDCEHGTLWQQGRIKVGVFCQENGFLVGVTLLKVKDHSTQTKAYP